jgi:hypothetical protein
MDVEILEANANTLRMPSKYLVSTLPQITIVGTDVKPKKSN